MKYVISPINYIPKWLQQPPGNTTEIEHKGIYFVRPIDVGRIPTSI